MTDDADFWARIEASAALVRGQPTYTQAGLVLSGNFNGDGSRDEERGSAMANHEWHGCAEPDCDARVHVPETRTRGLYTRADCDALIEAERERWAVAIDRIIGVHVDHRSAVSATDLLFDLTEAVAEMRGKP